MPLFRAGESAGLPQPPRRLANTAPRICCFAKGTPISRSAEGRCDRPIAPTAGSRAHGPADNFCSSATIHSRVVRECSGIWKSRIPSAARACRVPFGESAGLPQQPRKRRAAICSRVGATSVSRFLPTATIASSQFCDVRAAALRICGWPWASPAKGVDRCDHPIAPSVGARPARNLRHLCGTINVAERRFCQKSVRVLKSTYMRYRRDQRSMDAAALAFACPSAAKKIKCQLFTPDPTPPVTPLRPPYSARHILHAQCHQTASRLPIRIEQRVKEKRAN